MNVKFVFLTIHAPLFAYYNNKPSPFLFLLK